MEDGWCVTVNTTPPATTAKSANRSSTTGPGGERRPTAPTSVCVSLPPHVCPVTDDFTASREILVHLQLFHCYLFRVFYCETLRLSACECSGKSAECFFDAELYRATGHGGHCRNCADNTDGPNCERCLDNYYRDPGASRCLPCLCNPVGEWCTLESVCVCECDRLFSRCFECLLIIFSI